MSGCVLCGCHHRHDDRGVIRNRGCIACRYCAGEFPASEREWITLDGGWLRNMISRFADGTLDAGAIVSEIAATISPWPDRPAPPGADSGAVLVARCKNYREDVDRPCAGELRFRWGQSQSPPCSECGGRCGIAVASWDRVEQPEAETLETIQQYRITVHRGDGTDIVVSEQATSVQVEFWRENRGVEWPDATIEMRTVTRVAGPWRVM